MDTAYKTSSFHDPTISTLLDQLSVILVEIRVRIGSKNPLLVEQCS